MDRISALRNVEDALADFEADISLRNVEDRMLGVLRDVRGGVRRGGGLSAYRSTGDPRVEGVVVVAESSDEAHERVAERVDAVAELRVEHAY